MKPTKQIELALMVFRLWYRNPTIEVQNSDIRGIQLLIPQADRVKSPWSWNYPTCLCLGCSSFYENKEEGFSSPIRNKCGKCCSPTYTQGEVYHQMKLTNIYNWGYLDTFMRIYPMYFYQGEELDTFIKMNHSTLALMESLSPAGSERGGKE